MAAALNHELQSALSQYMAARKANSSVEVPLAGIINAMDLQAPSSISEADASIALAAELWSWQHRPSWWRRWFLRNRDDNSVLAENAEVAFLFIFHRNGFLRQAALNRISGPLPNTFLVAALAWRLNDWVSQVRDSALACAKRCLPKTDAHILANFFVETVRNRNSWGRWSLEEREILHQAINRGEVNRQIVTILLTGEQGPLPSVLSYLLRFEWIDAYLTTIAATAIIPGLRAIALRSLISGKAKYADGTVWRWINKPMGIRKREPRIAERLLTVKSDQLTLIQAGLADNSAVVRRVALSGLIEHSLFDAFENAVIRGFCDDPSESVRSRAKFILNKTAAGA